MDPAELSELHTLEPLEGHRCPGYTEDEMGYGRKGVIVRVVNVDGIDAAVSLERAWDIAPGGRLPHRWDSILVVNWSDNGNLGGGWRSGGVGQEAELCYRTSLSLTFDDQVTIQHNPPLAEGVYAAKVVIIRTSLAEGHAYHNLTSPDDLDYISVLSVASSDSYFADSQALKRKWRYILRLAATKRHRRLILSMPHPALMVPFKEVAAEAEFTGGWFKSVVIAVFIQGLDTAEERRIYDVVRGRFDGFFF